MKKVKLLLCVLTVLLLTFAITACGGDKEGDGEKKLDFEGLVFEDTEFTYDGTAKMIKVKGYPIQADVSYSANSSQTEAGTYEVTATVSLEGYNTKTLKAKLTINKAVYDMSGVRFSDKTVTYNGEARSIEISGTLPEGVSVSYEGNGVTAAGVHTVVAKFVGDSSNYEPIPDMTAKLTVKQASVPGVTFDDAEFTYDGEAKFIEISGTLPEGVSVSYEGNGVTAAGEYTVTAKFSATGNYDIPDMTAKIKINKATYDMTGVSFTDKSVTYNGTAQSLEIEGTLPDGVSVSYVGGEKTAVGQYTVFAKFTGDADNYELIPDQMATLTIGKATYDMTGVSFTDKSVTYNGEPQTIEISGTLPDGVSVSYVGGNKIDAGEYTVFAKFTGDWDNYELISDQTATLTVGKATYDMTGVGFTSKTVTYDGTVQSLEIVGTLPDGVSVSYVGGDKVNAGQYTVVAKFTGDQRNYELIPDMTATLTILDAEIEGFHFNSAEFTYDGKPKSIEIVGILPDGVSVSYEGNDVTDVGEYTVTAKFDVPLGADPIADMTATLTIRKAVYDMSGIGFADKMLTYDGSSYTIEITGTLPEGVSVSYTGGDKTGAGEYTVTASFAGDGDNYELIPDKKATLIIKKATYDMTGIGFSDKSVNYDGTVHGIEITGTLPQGVSVSYTGGGKAVGNYTVTAKFAGDADNYELIPDKIASLSVLGHTVTIVLSDATGATVSGGNVAYAAPGGDATAKITVKTTHVFESVSVGTYNTGTGELKIENVQSDITVHVNLIALGYDAAKTVRPQLNIDDEDTASIKSGQKVNLGTEITLTAGNSSRNFIGWSLGASLEDGGVLLGTERELVLKLIPDVIGDVVMPKIYSNYVDINILKYDPNGGTVNTSSTNMTGNSYYTAEYDGEVVTVTLSDVYINFAESASTFWDDGTFTRDGYVLIEYNTKPDGTGEGYSLGSKFFTASTPTQTLYCIWAQATPAADFEYEDVRWGYASGVSATTAPHWQIDGVNITKYTGNDEWVVIPEMIDGKYVTTIDVEAFVDKDVKVLVFNRFILRVEDGAFKNCPNLTTVYMNDSVFYMNDAAFDAATYTNFKHFYLNATMAPRFMKNTHGDGGVFSVKFSRLLASQNENRVIVVSGSSTYQGLGSAYLEGLLDGDYTVINLGTTRTGTGMIFFEALQHYTHEGDVVIYAPENHVNMFGENTMWYRSFYDLEGMYNLFRYIDISHYPSVFSALSVYNRGDENGQKGARYKRNPTAYEDIAGSGIRSDKYGDFQQAARASYREDCTTTYIDSYFITLNKYFKNDLLWSDIEYQTANKDYLTSDTWTDITIYSDEVNRVIELLRATGAGVYFGFAPVDADDVVPEAQNREWLSAYDSMILENYVFDGLLGTSADYVFAHNYFFDCAYHVNDYGRTYRTYQMYLDLCKILGIEDVKAIDGIGTNFAGCLFEEGSDGTPLFGVDYLQD